MTQAVFAIARSGMDVEWQRVEVIAANLANLNTTRTSDGTPYAAKLLITGPKFSKLLGGAGIAGQAGSGVAAAGVQVLGLEESKGAPKRVLDPAHPHADASGFVSYPNVDHVHEMTSMISASRVYEANLASFTSARSMFARAMELGAK
jgi:flagellar basal-body rod protein FlgC